MLIYIYADRLCCSCKMNHIFDQYRCKGIFWNVWWIFQNRPLFQKGHIVVKCLKPCFLSALILNKYLEVILTNPVHTNYIVAQNFYWAKMWCILLEHQSHSAQISFPCSTALKSNFPLKPVKDADSQTVQWCLLTTSPWARWSVF